MDYDILFEEVDLTKIKLKNRLVMAPMTTTSGEADGSFSAQEIKYLSQRANGGIAMIMTPACYVHKSGHAFERQVGCHSDKMIPSLRKCAEAINGYGSASILQIHHGGNAARESLSGYQPLAPSALRNRRETSEMPREMTEDEIIMLISSFAKSAGRAKQAGFTGIEIHGANTYLLQQFFSPYTNKRSDKWGGTFENRTRFAHEVVKEIRAQVGQDYPIIYRISPEEEDPLGYSTFDTIRLLELLVTCGIDIIHVSSWDFHDNLRKDIPEGTNPTVLIKKALPEIPVIGVGGIMTPEQALDVSKHGIDLVAMGKALMLEKSWAKMVQNGDSDKIRTKITSEEERQSLDIPDQMKEYSRHFFKV
jgi:2,4-dienoyl-CoA reductase-like NADH-dependent reductase (Old Yellow Enzyme family)